MLSPRSGCCSGFKNRGISSWSIVLRLYSPQNDLGNWLKPRFLGSPSFPASILRGLWFSGSDRPSKNEQLTKFCTMLKLLVWGSPFEDLSSMVNYLGNLLIQMKNLQRHFFLCQQKLMNKSTPRLYVLCWRNRSMGNRQMFSRIWILMEETWAPDYKAAMTFGLWA